MANKIPFGGICQPSHSGFELPAFVILQGPIKTTVRFIMTQAQVLPIPPSIPPFPPLAYRGTPVLTTDMLAQAYTVEPKQVRQNFANNRERFVEGKHYFSVSGQQLKAFRLCVENFDSQISAKVRTLTLWTERGAARHAKMLNSDKAWDVFELLEETFFREKDKLPPSTGPVTTITPSTVTDREPLRSIVSAWSRISGQPQNNLWPQVRAAFNITNIKQLPAEWIPDAIAWVQSKIDALPPGPEQLALCASPAILDEQAQKVQSLMNEVKQRGNELMSALFTLQSALRFRPVKMDPAVPDLSKALERNLPQFGTAIGMNVSALSDLLDVYCSTLTGTSENSPSPAWAQPNLPTTGDPYEEANARLEEMRRKYHALRDEAGKLLVEVMMDDERRISPHLLVAMPTPITDMTESFFRNSIDLHQSWSSNPVLLIRELHNALGLKREVPLDAR